MSLVSLGPAGLGRSGRHLGRLHRLLGRRLGSRLGLGLSAPRVQGGRLLRSRSSCHIFARLHGRRSFEHMRQRLAAATAALVAAATPVAAFIPVLGAAAARLQSSRLRLGRQVQLCGPRWYGGRDTICVAGVARALQVQLKVRSRCRCRCRCCCLAAITASPKGWSRGAAPNHVIVGANEPAEKPARPDAKRKVAAHGGQAQGVGTAIRVVGKFGIANPLEALACRCCKLRVVRRGPRIQAIWQQASNVNEAATRLLALHKPTPHGS